MLTLAAILLLASQVSASVLSNVASVLRRDDSLEHSMRRYVDSIVVEPVEKRSTASGLNATEWMAQTTVACMSALTALNGKANNPSGMGICYNVAYLDNSTGVFEADLRLYMIAPPTGDFATIPSSNVQVALAYNGATVSPLNATALKRSDESISTSLISWPRDETSSIQKRMVPTLIEGYCFIGQINKNLLITAAGTASLQKVLVPTVTLTGKTVSGATVNTTLTNDEATFVSGVFAAQVTPTTSRVVAPIQTLVVASNAPFVLPGVNLLIFPIGGVITGVWSILFIATIAYGTFGRMQFREQFRSRTARAQQKGNLTPI